MRYLRLFVFTIIITGINAEVRQDNVCLYQVFPLSSFKKVVDTCMRSYTDALVLHDLLAQHEKPDEQLDLLVGRLMRLQSYVEQLIVAYQNEATVSIDELDYLMRMIEYLEFTIDEHEHKSLAQGLNGITQRLKMELKQALGLLSLYLPMQVPLFHHQSPIAISRSRQFA